MADTLSKEEIDQLLHGLSDFEVDYKELDYCKHEQPCGLCDLTLKKCEVKKNE